MKQLKINGFTLVELLAVIIIISLLALLTGTAVTKLVKGSKKDLHNAQIQLVKSAVETWGAENMDKLPSSGECGYITLLDLKESGFVDSNITDPETNQELSNDLKIKISTTVNDYGKVLTNYEVGVSVNADECSWINHYKNGEVVYFDVNNGVSCTKYDYHADNSKTGYNGLEATKTTNNQNGCLKFYVFNDYSGKKANLLLDHNTTGTIAWTNSSTTTNKNGPIDVINQLKIDTDGWKGTEAVENYIDPAKKYEIDYNGYKARLITANEVAQIVGNKYWDSETATSTLYFQGGTDGSSCASKGCTYGWLYDRTSCGCKANGCSNAADSSSSSTMYGYWTSTASASSTYSAFPIFHNGSLLTSNAPKDHINYETYMGVRPVIEVLKNNI